MSQKVLSCMSWMHPTVVTCFPGLSFIRQHILGDRHLSNMLRTRCLLTGPYLVRKIQNCAHLKPNYHTYDTRQSPVRYVKKRKQRVSPALVKNLYQSYISSGEFQFRSNPQLSRYLSDFKKTSQNQTEGWSNLSHWDLSDMFCQLRHDYPRDHRSAFVFENVMIARLPDLDATDMLHFAESIILTDFWGDRYLSSMFDMVNKKFETLCMNPTQITKLMFCVFFNGSGPLDMFTKVEEHLLANFNDFTLCNLSVICLGFFRGHKRIVSYELLDRIAERVLDEVDAIDENMLSNILKSFRHSGVNRPSFYQRLADIYSQENRLQKFTQVNRIMHLAMTYASLRIYHSQFLTVLGKHILNILSTKVSSNVRTKEIARLVWIFGTFCYKPENFPTFYEKLIEAFQVCLEKEKTLQYPESLADLVQGLIYVEIFPEKEIQTLLSENTVITLRDHPTMEKVYQILLADTTVSIECPDYTGNRLSKALSDALLKIPGISGDVAFELGRRKGLKVILQALQSMWGQEKVHCHFVLPHVTLADIEMRLDGDNQLVKFQPVSYVCPRPVNQSVPAWQGIQLTDRLYKSLTRSSTEKAPIQHRRILIEIMGENQCAMGTEMLLGNAQTKLRQLRKLGYEILLILPSEASSIEIMTDEERAAYILTRLNKEFGIYSPQFSTTKSK